MLKGVGAFAAMLILGGCATVTRGTTDQVQMRSAPSGAIATASMGQSCTTPCTITVGRKDEFSVHFEKPGFISQDVQVKTQASGPGQAALAGNLIVGGIVGLATDASTGATLDHVPNPVSVELRPARASAKFRPLNDAQSAVFLRGRACPVVERRLDPPSDCSGARVRKKGARQVNSHDGISCQPPPSRAGC